MNAGALGRTAKRHAGKGIAIVAAGVAAAALFTVSASATSSGGTTLRLTAKATAVVLVKPCRTCVTSTPAEIGTGQVVYEHGTLSNARGSRVGSFAAVITVVTPHELLINSTLVLGPGQITAQGIEPSGASSSTLAITGGTGRYQSAGGEIRFRDTSHTTQVLQVIIDQ